MRLNSTLDCPGCKKQINPFVLVNANGYADKRVQCPSCLEEFVARCDTLIATPDEFAAPHWIAKRLKVS
jgi:hypothetical protein